MSAPSASGRGSVSMRPTVDCLCTANSVACHHPGSIWMTAAFVGYKRVDGFAGKTKVPMMKLRTPPPRPEPTAHLAVLRNPIHPEWKARPASYLSPALCNISSTYITRVIEPEARRRLIERGDYSRNVSFSLGYAQLQDLKRQREVEKRFRREQARRKAKDDAYAFSTSSSSTSSSSSSESDESPVESVAPSPDGDEDEDSRLTLVRYPARRPLPLELTHAYSRGEPSSIPVVQYRISRNLMDAMSHDIISNAVYSGGEPSSIPVVQYRISKNLMDAMSHDITSSSAYSRGEPSSIPVVQYRISKNLMDAMSHDITSNAIYSRREPRNIPIVQYRISKNLMEAMSHDITSNASRNTTDIVHSRPIDIVVPNNALPRANVVRARRLNSATRSEISRTSHTWPA